MYQEYCFNLASKNHIMKAGKIILGIIALAAISLFELSLILPFFVVFLHGTGATFSFWRDGRPVAIIASLIFSVLTITPLLSPKGMVWILPLAGSLLISGLALIIIVGNGADALITHYIFAGAGIALFCEAVMTQYLSKQATQPPLSPSK